ncbi:DNA repair-scaffolding protein-like isoform X2 [Littorina saxatilis]|uniref:DNA repair-scaffolding protein-like isoform X2 n=1 Tax=Littorina saxatilis TaxID=31220 RepID=UPI0038B58133
MRKKAKLSDAAHYSHRPGAGDGFSATRTEAQGSHDKQSAPVATTPNQWQRCSEGFCLSESKRNKSPVRKSQPKLNYKNPEQKVPTPKVVRNFGQRWIQSEELFDAVGSQKPWQRANDSLSKPASRSKASVSRSPKPTEDADIDPICWSESESDSEDPEKHPNLLISTTSKTSVKKQIRKAPQKRKTPRIPYTGDLKQGLEEGSETETGDVISAAESEEEQQEYAEKEEVLPSSNDPSPTLEIECVGSPQRSPELSANESSHAVLQNDTMASHRLHSPRKGKELDVETPSISSCVSSQSGPESDVSPSKGGLRASEWAKQVKWETTPSKQRTPTPPDQADSAKKKKKFAKGGLAEQMSRILLREKSSIRMWQHQHSSDNTQQDPKSMVVRVRNVKPVYSLQLAGCSVVRSALSQQHWVNPRCFVALSPHVCHHKAPIQPGALLRIYPPWQQLDTPDGHKVLLCTRYVVSSQTSATPGQQTTELTGVTDDDNSFYSRSASLGHGIWMCPCSSDAVLSPSNCPAHLFPFLPATLLQQITPTKTVNPSLAGRTLHTVTGNEGAPKRTLTFDTLLESIEKARSGDKLLPSFQATVLRVFWEQLEGGCKRPLVLMEDSQGTVALVTGADHVSPSVEGNLCSFSSLRVLSRTNADRDPALFSAVAAAWSDKVKRGTQSQESGNVPHSEDSYYTSQHVMQPPGFCYLLEVDRCGTDALYGEDWLSVVTSHAAQLSSPPVLTTLATALQSQEQSHRVSLLAKVIYHSLKNSSTQDSGDAGSASNISELFICDHSLLNLNHDINNVHSTSKAEDKAEQCKETIPQCKPSSSESGSLPGFVQIQIQEDCVTDSVKCAVRKHKDFSPFVVLLRDAWWLDS